MSSDRTVTLAALEAALAKSPKDRVILAAITDHLLERGDLRGEFMDYLLDAAYGSHGSEYRIRGPEVAGRRERDGLAWIGVPDDLRPFVTVQEWFYLWPTRIQARRVRGELLVRLAESPFLKSLQILATPRPMDDVEVNAVAALRRAGVEVWYTPPSRR